MPTLIQLQLSEMEPLCHVVYLRIFPPSRQLSVKISQFMTCLFSLNVSIRKLLQDNNPSRPIESSTLAL